MKPITKKVLLVYISVFGISNTLGILINVNINPFFIVTLVFLYGFLFPKKFTKIFKENKSNQKNWME